MNESKEITREVEELTARCKQACDSYRHVSAELGAWMNEQRSIVNQHQDLLIRSSLDLRDAIEKCSEAQQQLLGHLQALCTKGEHVKDLSNRVKALKSDVQSLLALMRDHVQKA